jgi:hypothetical protein
LVLRIAEKENARDFQCGEYGEDLVGLVTVSNGYVRMCSSILR